MEKSSKSLLHHAGFGNGTVPAWITVITLLMLSTIGYTETAMYKPNWESLDSRPIPQWFDDAKFGIFVVWGVYSVPSWAPKGEYAEWYWGHALRKDHPTHVFHNKTYGEKFRYQDFVEDFRAELFDPEQWADLFERSGAKYVVMTAQYHDGFCLWPSPYAWNWNSVDIGPHRDLIGDLTEPVRKRNIKMGNYYSVYEWFHPFYLADVDKYVEEHFHPQFKDLVTRYKPDILFMDGEWDHDSATWRTPELLAWLYNESPCREEIVVNDRWGKETRGVHGGYYTTEYGIVYGKKKPGEEFRQHKWEESRGMGSSYGYNRNEDIFEYKSATELIHLLVDIVSMGGNLLLDIGPTADGRIPVIMQERMIQIGEWLGVNGEAIYGTRPWRENGEGDTIRYTRKEDAVYAICMSWPGPERILRLPKTTPQTQVSMLGKDGLLKWHEDSDGLHIAIPPLSVDEVPCRHAYTLKLTHVE